MNKLTIIGNLTRDPEMRVTSAGIDVCNFTVAVNRRNPREGQPEADFFRVSAWRQLGTNCGKFLSKGRKVCVVGPVGVTTYQANDGTTRAQLEVTAEDVEFLSSQNAPQGAQNGPENAPDGVPAGFTQVDPGNDELPF